MDHAVVEIPSCPFCDFSDLDSYFLTQHVEPCHPENGYSPFSAEQDSDTSHLDKEAAYDIKPPCSSSQQGQLDDYVNCPHGRGEQVASVELSNHLDFHIAEGMAHEEAGMIETEMRSLDVYARRSDCPLGDTERQPDSSLCNHSPVFKTKASRMSHQQQRSESSFSDIPSPTGPDARFAAADAADGGIKRLGRAELGPHAHEKQMPSWLRRMLENGAKVTRSNRIGPNGILVRREAVENETSHVIPVLAQLCQQDSSVQRAFFCSPKVRHVFKMSREGGFCGYRNIQMLVSYIQDSRASGHEHFPGMLPTILKLQDMIERAWDMGFNSTGRIETGGIRGTRKYIGTPEAQALFLSLGIRCEANAFSETKEMRAHDALFMDMAEYFRQACSLEGDEKVFKTDLPPIYLQHKGHSVTVIGFEVRKNGSANLLVFDPVFKTSPAIQRLIGTTVKTSDPTRLMKAYRRGAAYLQKYKDFEVLKLLSRNGLSENHGDSEK
ncbi:hypothetical protein VTN00DRAFT_983 [Thermoascus crustaceus]|uniref:uncharacterized protein n=1 Tax=Thermoascus crustaceus TaxID=5088 RepID=UPI0037436520